jgi:hypothetical protein
MKNNARTRGSRKDKAGRMFKNQAILNTKKDSPYLYIEPPEMTYRGLTEFLGEKPIARRRTKEYGTFVKLRDVLISPKAHTEKRKKYWNQPYFHGLVKLFNEWSVHHHTFWNEFILKVSMLIEYYCTCLPASTICGLLGKTSGGRLSCWSVFDIIGNLISKPWEIDRMDGS